MDTDLNSGISAFLSNCEDHQLFLLSRFYMERLEQAIEEGVEGVGFMLMGEDHFSGPEYHSVTVLAEKGNRSGASKLLLDLVMEKGSGARRVMWESFVQLHHHLPKLSRILNEIQERGDGQFAYMDTERGLSVVPKDLKDVQQNHKETLRTQTETLRVNTILMREKVKVFKLVDRYVELTVISTVRDRTLVEHELLARGKDHEEWRQKRLRRELDKIRTDQLFQNTNSYSHWDKMERFFTPSTSGCSAAVAGVPGIGKTTMVQKIVYDWATGKIYQQFQFVFSFKFRDLNTINCRINLRELILDQYPYFGNILREVWKNPEGLLFIFDGLDEFKHKIDFADSRRDTEPKHQCPDPEWWCEVSDIVYSLIQGKLLPGCSVLVTTRPTALHLLEKADEVKYQSGNTVSEAGKRSLLNTLHYLFESQNRGLAQAALGSVETLSFSGMTLTPIDCAVLSHGIGLCDTIKRLDLFECHIQCEGIQRLGPGLHKCQELGLGRNKLGDSGVKLVSAALRNLECKIQTLELIRVGLTDAGAEDLVSALSTNPSLTELNLSENKLGDSGVKLVSAALRNPECKIQKLQLRDVGLTDSGAKDLVSALSTNQSLFELGLSDNELGNSGVKLVSASLRNPECKIQKLE
ncbi:NACHT, LRR and PYD domains-containing protein 3-like [Hypanus sabinus]|uniref:NACHT, LRR and PYD domains-containing protein 3-like n=1 Tax=Hypanus sabinus TaxID=79690 RepID=UPI0028C4BC54|nr:NACHT, LRR and PYD domains-containing protein 3-like [Hypanus sabinus]